MYEKWTECTKITTKTRTLWVKILTMVKKHGYLYEIARQLNKPKTTIQYHINKLEKAGFIQEDTRSNIKTYKLTKSGINFLHKSRTSNVRKVCTKSSPREREGDVIQKPRTHNVKIKFPIFQDNPYATFEKQTHVNNWIKQYDYVPFDVTIEKTTQNIIAHIHNFTTSYYNNTSDFYQQILKVTGLLHAYLAENKNIKIDVFNPTILNKHTANVRQQYNETLDNKSTASLDLNRPANTIWPNNMQATAWFDRSHDDVEIETNDLQYEEKLLAMPENIHELNTDIRHILQHYANNVTTHVKFMQEIIPVLEKINDKLDKL